MNNNKTNLLVVCCFMICGSIGISNLIKDSNKTINNELQDGEELITGDSFLNYGVIKGLKNTDYELSVNVSPSNHTSKVVWTSDFPELVSVEAISGDKAVIRRLDDYKGYVNIKASIDGLEACCRVYSIAKLKYLEVSLSDKTNSLSHNGEYYDSYDNNNNSYKIVVDVKVSHDYIYYSKTANEGNYSYEYISSLIDAENNINLYEPNFIRLEQFTNNFKLSNNNNYESYTLSYEYYNASTSYDWEFEYNDFFAYICSFTEYIEANSISIESETITI